jgi:hypothetical protein
MSSEILIGFQGGGLKWVCGSIDVILYMKIRDSKTDTEVTTGLFCYKDDGENTLLM